MWFAERHGFRFDQLFTRSDPKTVIVMLRVERSVISIIWFAPARTDKLLARPREVSRTNEQGFRVDSDLCAEVFLLFLHLLVPKWPFQGRRGRSSWSCIEHYDIIHFCLSLLHTENVFLFCLTSLGTHRVVHTFIVDCSVHFSRRCHAEKYII